MKDFYCRQTAPSEWKKRFVWRDDISRPESQESLDDLELKNPLKFGAKDLRLMEANRKDLTPEQKNDFRDIAGYFISLKHKLGSKNLPPHMLVQMEQSPLFSLLSKKMQEQIHMVLDNQINELADEFQHRHSVLDLI